MDPQKETGKKQPTPADLQIGDNVLYNGVIHQIISFVPSSGKFVLAGVGNPVSPTDLSKSRRPS